MARIEGAHHGVCGELGAVGQGDARGPAVLRDDRIHGRLEADLRAERLRRAGEHLGEPAVAALVERPGAELAVVLAQRVKEQHEPRALRARSDRGADGPGARELALEDVGLEVVVQEVRGAAGQQPHGVVERALVHPPEPPTQRRERQDLLGVVAEEVGRRLVEERLERPADHVQVVAVLLVGVRVALAVARDLLEVPAVILGQPQVVAVLHGSERRRHEQRHEAVLGELQVLDDLRPQEREGVRERGEPEAGTQLLGDGGATDEVSPLQDQGPQAGFREVGAVDEAVVAAADDDGVVGAVGARRLRGRRGGLLAGLGGRLLRRHLRPSFAPGCRAATGLRARRPARSDGPP